MRLKREAIPRHESIRGGSAGDIEKVRVYLAERDIVHHAMALHGVRVYLADARPTRCHTSLAQEGMRDMKLYLVDGSKMAYPDLVRVQEAIPMKMYLADTSNGYNPGSASQGLKTYLADANPQRHVEPQHGVAGVAPSLRLRILLSYHYYKKLNLDEMFAKHFTYPYPEVFLDSGAFSAFTQNETIDLSAYCDYINRFKHLITTYSNLDVISSAKGTLANQKDMECEGLKPLPVFHVSEDWKYLEDYITHYTYIALGGMVPYLKRDKRKQLMSWLLRCFKMAQGRSVFHGFGCTSWDVVCAYPWYSVDSSSWGASFRYGQVPLFDQQNGKFVEARLGDHKTCYQFAHLFRALGFDPADFAERARNERKKNCAVAALSYLQSEQWLQRRHGPIIIPERNEVPA